MQPVVVSIDVTMSPDEAFAYWSDWSNNPNWQQGQESCVWTSEPPMRIGSTYDQRASMLGRPIVSSFEVVEFEAGRRVRIRTTRSTVPLDITREVTPLDGGGSRLTATIGGGPTGPGRLLDPLMRVMVRRNVTKDYARLKALLDGGGAQA